jgi:phage/plasmid-associated DNA primase
MGLFSDSARRYWDRDLPAIPLVRGDKRPALKAWERFCNQMPTTEEQELWLAQYGDSNIGLPLGPRSGLVCIDIDSKDQRVHELFDRILPKSPWKRIGAKGYAIAYRHRPGMRSFQIKTKDENIMDFLSTGRQLVLPPSIHPSTQKPYVANVELVDVLPLVPDLPEGFEKQIRDGLKELGYNTNKDGGHAKMTDFLPAGVRDNEMVHRAGAYAHDVRKGRITVKEGIGAIYDAGKNLTEQIAGDAYDPMKAVSKFIGFLKSDVAKGSTLPEGWDDGLTEEDKENLDICELSESERWGLPRIIEYLKDRFERHTDPYSNEIKEALNFALGKFAANTDFTPTDEDRLINFVRQASRGELTKRSLQKQVSDLRKKAKDVPGDNQTEIALAMIDTHLTPFGDLCLADCPYQWNGAYWEPLKYEAILKKIQDNFGHLPAAKRYTDHVQIHKIMCNQLNGKQLPLYDEPIINFANGAVTEELELIPHNPAHGKSYVLPYRYLPDQASNCPLFFDLLHRCWGDDEDFQLKVDALQEAMAATMFGIATQFQKAICLKGQARSGKSSILNIMLGLMINGSASSIPPEEWGNQHHKASMFGKLMNECGEISERKKIPGEWFKKIIDGRTIEDRHLYGQLFRFSPRCAQWFCANPLPKSDDTTEGFSRRWLFLEFPNQFALDEVVPEFEKKVIVPKEREAIASWAVQAIIRLKANNHYTLPSSHERLLNDMRCNNNTVYDFLKTNCGGKNLRIGRVRHRGISEHYISQSELHHQYVIYCMCTQQRPDKEPQFREKMKDLQNTFDFKLEDRVIAGGGMKTFYHGISALKEGWKPSVAA